MVKAKSSVAGVVQLTLARVKSSTVVSATQLIVTRPLPFSSPSDASFEQAESTNAKSDATERNFLISN
jgi:hypothetical protein